MPAQLRRCTVQLRLDVGIETMSVMTVGLFYKTINVWSYTQYRGTEVTANISSHAIRTTELLSK